MAAIDFTSFYRMHKDNELTQYNESLKGLCQNYFFCNASTHSKLQKTDDELGFQCILYFSNLCETGRNLVGEITRNFVHVYEAYAKNTFWRTFSLPKFLSELKINLKILICHYPGELLLSWY